VASKGEEIKSLRELREAATPGEHPAFDQQLRQLETEKEELRREELRALEWTPIWGIPAIFAAFVLILFVIVFKDRTREAAAG